MNRVTKRRRKAIKSCSFCRKRKLKCDQAKPMCKQCVDRKLPDCVYTDEFNYEITTDELFSNTPNVELVQRIKELEAQLSSTASCCEEYTGGVAGVTPQSMSAATPSTSTGSNTARNSISCPAATGVNNLVTQCAMRSSKPTNNPLWDYRILNKSEGQSIIFGPTSWRTTVAAQGTRFLAEYKKLWEMIKPERDRWMIQNSNPNYCTPPLGLLLRTHEPQGLIEAVCKLLPSHADIEKDIDVFFSSTLHDMLRILDKDKVMRDFKECFIVSDGLLIGFGQPVIDLVAPQNDGNFFKVAVILMLVCIVEYKGCIPQTLNKFFISLTSLNTASKLNFIERSQFSLLRFFNKIYCSYDCCEATQLANLAAEVSECSLNLGLSNVDWWYKGQETLVGPLETLRYMWYWTLYTDVVVSFEMGKPLFISDDHFDPSITFDIKPPMAQAADSVTLDKDTAAKLDDPSAIEKDVQTRRLSILLEFLKISRKCLTEVNGRTTSGNIQESIDALTQFVDSMFLPIKFYTMKEKIELVDLFDVVVLSPCLGMLLNFHNIQRMCLKMKTSKVKNGLVKFGLLSLSLSVNTILLMCEKDRVSEKEGKDAAHLNLALFLINPLLIRVLSEMYALFFYRISLFEKGVIIAGDKGISDIGLHDTKVPEDQYYSFNATIRAFRKTIDQFFDPSRVDLQKKIGKSYQLTTALALERVSRTLFDKGLESRTMTENSCNLHDDGYISEDVLNQMTDIFWNNYEQQSHDLWQMKPQDFYTDFTLSQLEFDLNLK